MNFCIIYGDEGWNAWRRHRDREEELMGFKLGMHMPMGEDDDRDASQETLDAEV